jgi:hypothetical protein
MRLRNEVTHETERRRLVDPSANPASVSDVRRLEEAEALDQEGLFFRVSADSDARPAFVDLENSERAPRDSEVGMTPGLDFGSSRQSRTKPPNPSQWIELFS